MVRITRGMAARMEPEGDQKPEAQPEAQPESKAESQQQASTPSTAANLTVPIMVDVVQSETTTVDIAKPETDEPQPQPEPEPAAPTDASTKPVDRPKRRRIRTEKQKVRAAAYNRKKRQQSLAAIRADPLDADASSPRAGRPQSFKALQKLFLKQQHEVRQLKKQAAKSA
ncbi:hypothetical protein BD289DRAFT_484956 [Coniella lustricola]|uniref:Uncharacterized protein n=1 Tax=Coniella lustricola TaxID=2025994 RepID=A0A2T3A0A1_9PEZI|nr:hypothetical protein BD289DRAFT_484956 [Coniella lustricola]